MFLEKGEGVDMDLGRTEYGRMGEGDDESVNGGGRNQTIKRKKEMKEEPSGRGTKWTDLDKYIELLLENPDKKQCEFIYLNPNENCDPYDLKISGYEERNLKEYYTISTKGKFNPPIM